MQPRDVGAAVCALRQRSGLRQVDLAAQARTSQSTVSRVERGLWDEISWSRLKRVCDAAGLRLGVEGRWRGGELARLLDRDHAALGQFLRPRLEGMGWRSEVEVTYSRYGERGSIDLLAFQAGSGQLVVVELKTVIADVQGILRPLDAKVRLARGIASERAWRAQNVVPCLVVTDTTTNRRRLAEHAALFAGFRLRGRAAGAWLRRPVGDPGGLLLLVNPPGMRRGNLRRAGQQRVRLRSGRASVREVPGSGGGGGEAA